ncbi:unnamed protein product [Prunus brigantina]
MHFLSSLLEAASHRLVSTTIIGSLTPRMFLLLFILDGTVGVWDVLKVQIALIAWIMVVLLLLGVALVACPPPFSVDHWYFLGGCRLATVARLVNVGLCGICPLMVLGFPNVVLSFVGFCILWVLYLYVGPSPLCGLYAFMYALCILLVLFIVGYACMHCILCELNYLSSF